jgi:hypothetical protein
MARGNQERGHKRAAMRWGATGLAAVMRWPEFGIHGRAVISELIVTGVPLP